MKEAFLQILNMSLTGSAVILLVLAARLLLKRAPKIFSYALWGVVLFRLLCPVSLSASVSMLGWLKPEVQSATPVTSTVSYLPDTYIQNRAEAMILPQAAPVQPQEVPADKTEAPDFLDIASDVWLAGAAIMALYSAAQYLRLHKKLAGAALSRKGVYVADCIDTPFVMGVLRPRIYLPSGLSGQEQEFILAHEQRHIRRGDPLWKLLGYLALCLHWFNPLAWAAFILASKDMEMSCDEAVIKQLGAQIRADYSAALLRLTAHQSPIAGMPLAFGEGDTKGRIINMARWKKPKTWVRIACGAVCLGILMACGLNPRQAEGAEEVSRLSGPASVRVGELSFRLPAGLTYEGKENAPNKDAGEIMGGSNVVGGVMTFPMPEDVSGWDWLQALDLWEWEDASLGYYADSFGAEGVTLEFFSDVPEGVERTVLRKHQLFFGGDMLYDLWLDELLMEPSLQEELLSTAKIGPESEQTISPLPYEIGTLPEGYSTLSGENGDILFTNGTSIVGGITGYQIPEGVYDPNDDIFLWLEDVGIPDYEDSTLAFWGGISDFGGGWTATFASDVPEGADITVKRTHHFSPSGSMVFDFWLDELLLDTQTQFALEDAVRFTPPVSEAELERTGRQLQTELTFYIEGMEETCPATLHMEDDYSLYIPDEGWTHYIGNLDYQPLQRWESQVNPEVALQIISLNGMTLSQAQHWVIEEMPDYTLIYDKQGGLGGTDAENNMADIRFCVSKDAVYGICCFYPMEAAEGFGTRLYAIADTFALTTVPKSQTMTAEDYAFSQCFSVMDGLQDGSVHMQTVCEYDNTPGDNYTEDFYLDGEFGWMRITKTAGGETHAELYADDRYFTGAGNGELAWTETDALSEWSGPWLGGFNFIKHYVTYIDTLSGDDGTWYMFRVDAPFTDEEGAVPNYFVEFLFDADGNFVKVQIHVNSFQEDAFTLTESIVTLDADTVAGDIEREYQHAMG